MSAEVLREAAALIRERAEAATDGPWVAYGDHLVWPSENGPAANDPILAMVGDAHDDSAHHIASWHPAVALAVADLLDRECADQEKRLADLRSAFGEAGDDFMPPCDSLLLALARAYLGRDS